MSEVLPYLEIATNESADKKEFVEVPEVRGKSIKEASEILKDNKLDVNINLDGDIDKEKMSVEEQIPKPGLKVIEGTKIDVTIKNNI